MNKHCFGSPVPCKLCGLRVSAVWAYTLTDAQSGLGICDDCRSAAAAAPIEQPSAPPATDKSEG